MSETKAPVDNFDKKLDKCIQSITKKEGYSSYDIVKRSISTNGGSYLGDLYEIDIKGKINNITNETPIFVKAMSANGLATEMISLDNVYNRELFVYKNIFTIFKEMQDQAEIPESEKYKMARCYEEAFEKAIILENLTKKGFRSWYRLDSTTLDLAEECIKQLARFHGLSLATEKKRSKDFQNVIKTLVTPYNFASKQWDEYIDTKTKDMLSYLDKDLRKRVEEKVNQTTKKMKDYNTQEAPTSRCICHGDYRPNNILVKEQENKITEVVPVDFQLAQFNCPILDFFYFIYISTTGEFREKHLTNLKELYFCSLKKYLEFYGIDVESVYPREDFESDYVKFRDYGIIVSAFFLPFVYASEDHVPDLSTDSLVNIDFGLDPRFGDRIVEIFEEFDALGFFSRA